MSTVNISLKDILKRAVSCGVNFVPVNTPFVDGVPLVVSGRRVVRTDSNGIASVELEPGSYKVTFDVADNSDDLIIGVPDDDDEYQFAALINAGTSIPVPPVYQGQAATIEIGDVATSESGGDAEVENVGDEHHAVLNITLPRGLKGEKGDTPARSDLSLSVSVKDLGAKGDGTTDDTAAIQAALDQQSKTVFFPAGTYKISDALIIKGNGRILIGDSPETSRIFQSNDSKNGLECSTSAPPNELLIENLRIYGNGTTSNSNAGFYSRNADGTFFMTSVMFMNCEIRGFSVGVHAVYLPRLMLEKTVIIANIGCKFDHVDTFLLTNFRGYGVKANTDSKIFEITGGNFTGKVLMAELGTTGHIADVQAGVLEFDNVNIEDVSGDYVVRIGALGRFMIGNSRISVESGTTAKSIFRCVSSSPNSGTLIILPGAGNNFTAPGWRPIEVVGTPVANVINFNHTLHAVVYVTNAGADAVEYYSSGMFPIKKATSEFNTPSVSNRAFIQMYQPKSSTAGYNGQIAKDTPIFYGMNVETGLFSRQALSNDVLMRVLNHSAPTTAIGNSGTSETDLYSYTVPARTMAQNGDRLRFEAFGLTAANASSKQIKVVLGSTTLLDTGTISPNGESWSIDIMVIRTGSATSRITVRVLSDGSEVGNFCKTVTSSTNWVNTAVIAVKATGVTTGDITLHGAVATWIKSDYAY